MSERRLYEGNYVERRRQRIADGNPPPRRDSRSLFRTIPTVKLTLLTYLQDIKFDMEREIDKFKRDYRETYGKKPPKMFKTKVRELDEYVQFYEQYISEELKTRGYEAVRRDAIRSVHKAKKMFEELSELMTTLENMFAPEHELTSDSSVSEISASD